MKILDKMEKKFGKYAIHNISLMLIICYGFGYAIRFVNPAFLGWLTLNPYLVLRGQVWRLVTWILVPPESFSIFTLIMLYFYYSIGTTLERTLGAFRYNVFLIGGMVFTVIGSFVLLGYCYLAYGTELAMAGPTMFFTQYINFAAFSTYYVNMSIFLAFAMTFPDMQVLLMFILPIKVKWLGIIYAAMLCFDFMVSNVGGKIIIGASLLNVILFFFAGRSRAHLSPKQIKRRQEFRHEVKKSTGITRHKCAICGRTEEDGELEFRFCSKCEGNYEYCQDHLFTHQHVRRQ